MTARQATHRTVRALRALGVAGLLAAVAASAGAQEAREAQQQAPPFPQWLADLRAEAETQGIGAEILDSALTGLEPDPKVIELDRRQPEFTQTYEQYLTARVSETRVNRGREMMAAHADTLGSVAAAYGVQPRFIVAIWGMETNYGSFTGGMDVIRSLATLAWDRRRHAYFRSELLNALKILEQGHIARTDMKGSWAGAMGHGQFMPSSFLEYAQDFDGDGRRDIWANTADVFASIANYLKRFRWRDDMTWGRRVLLPADFAAHEERIAPDGPPRSCRRALRHHSRQLDLAEWQALGVRRLSGTDLPTREFKASLVRPGGADGPAYLTYGNFRSVLRYNCSNFYALAVGHLADRLR